MKTISDAKVTVSSVYTAAGTSAVVGSTIDMTGFNCVAFVCAGINVANAGNYIKVQQGSASDLSDAADLLGSKQVTTGSNGSAIVEVFRPTKRYVRCTVIRGSSSACEAVLAILCDATGNPQSNTSAKRLNSPAEGTP